MPNNVTYHLQELAFNSWFFNQMPSSGIFGWYSSNGTFRTGAAACVDSVTAKLNPVSLSFASQNLGTVSPPQTFTVNNSGSAPLALGVVSVTGANPSDFSQTNNCTGSLDPGKSCTVSVTFSPTAAGARTGTVNVVDSASDSPQIESVTGIGSGVGLNSQRLTLAAPPLGGSCVVPLTTAAFTPADHTVYLWFNATVNKSDILSNDWLSPDGTVVQGKIWTNLQGSTCFNSASLDISNLPPSRIGTWAARISYGGVIATLPFTVTAAGAPVFRNSYILSQVADGGGWRTALNLINPSLLPVTFQVNLANDSGGALPINAGGQTASVFNGTIAPGASVTYTSSGTLGSQDGLAMVGATSPLVASGVFSFGAPGQGIFEAAVPALTMPAQTLILPFDNLNGKSTGIALANTGPSAATVAFTFHSEDGALTTLGTLALGGNSKTAFVLTDKFSQLRNQRGTLTMDAGVPVLTALGIRGLPTGAFTSLPVYPVSGSNSVVPYQVLGHVIDGGIWQSTITLVNTDTQTASYRMRILDSSGNLTPTTLNGVSGSVFNGSIAPLCSVTLATPGASSPAPLDGWADISSSQRIQAQLVFDQNTPGQPVFEAAVPSTPGGQASVAMPFDNTNGLVTGIAVTNVGAAASLQLAVRDESGNLTDNKIVAMGAGTKTAFVLTSLAPGSANKRGLVQVTAPGGSVTALALRFNGLEFTTLPVASADPAAAPPRP